MTEQIKVLLWSLNDNDFNNEDISTRDRKVEGLASTKLRERIDKFPYRLQKYLTRKLPDIFNHSDSDTLLKKQAAIFYQNDMKFSPEQYFSSDFIHGESTGGFIEFLKQPSLFSGLSVDIATCVHEVLDAAKMPITKHDFESLTRKTKEDKPPKLIIKGTEREELERQYSTVIELLKDIKETKFDRACIIGKNWQSANDKADYNDHYNVLKRDLTTLLESYAVYKKAAVDICTVQKKEDIEEQSRLLPYRHLVSAIEQRFNELKAVVKIKPKISKKNISNFYIVVKIAFKVVEEILHEEYKLDDLSSPDPENLIKKHLAELRSLKTQQF